MYSIFQKRLTPLLKNIHLKRKNHVKQKKLLKKELPKLQNDHARLLEHQLPVSLKRADTGMIQAMATVDMTMVHTVVVTDLITMVAVMAILVGAIMAAAQTKAKKGAEKAVLLVAVAVVWEAVELRVLKVKKDKKKLLNRQLVVP